MSEQDIFTAQGILTLRNIVTKGRFDNYCVYFEGRVLPNGGDTSFYLNKWGTPIPIYMEGKNDPIDASEYEGMQVKGSVKFTQGYSSNKKLVNRPIAIQIEELIEVLPEMLDGNPFMGDPVNEAPSEEPRIKNLAQLHDEAARDNEREDRNNE